MTTISFLTILPVILCGTVAIAEGPVVDGVALGDMQLSFNGNEQHRTYLGVASEATLSVSQIRADRLIIVVFNSYCTICQADAPLLNSVYQAVEEDPLLKGRVKIIGIGTGNTEAEVEHFRQSYNVPFPLFADLEFKLDRAVTDNLRAPMFVAVKNLVGKPLQVVQTHMGALKGVSDLLEEPLASAAMSDSPLPPAKGVYAKR
jgi:thiol-disulfide isomerase/thioredoxin